MKPNRLSLLRSFLNENGFLLLAGFLISFIPLYPKLPLFDAIPGYIVRVRLEDIFVLGAAILWGVQVLRQRASVRAPIFYGIAAYAVVGVLSIISAVLITQTVPTSTIHVAKTALHYFRYIEYFTLIGIVGLSIRSRRDIHVLLATLMVTTLLIGIYGYGQKFFYWPVFSTMNREFSKGVRLYLTEHARVQSTFGGHYDMAGFLVLMLPLTLALIWNTTKRWLRVSLWAIFLISLWLLTASASRISYAAYVASLPVVILAGAWTQSTLRERIRFTVSKGIILGLITLALFQQFGGDIEERMLHFIEAFPKVHNTYHTINGTRKQVVAQVVEQLPFLQKPDAGVSTDDAAQLAQKKPPSALTPTDERPTTRPKDVFVEVPEPVEVTQENEDGSVSVVTINRDRVFSDNAMKYGLSMAIRLDSLWPQALRGFQRNPVLGSGYATLTKTTTDQFTEADSTDNNFLRTLGETGLAGFLTFYGILVLSTRYAITLIRSSQDSIVRALGIGFLGGTAGILANAIMIDVFAASKVAFTYWALAGLVYGAYRLEKQ